MKIILTSSGLETVRLRKEFVNLLEKKVDEAKVMVIHTAKKPEHFIFVNEVAKELGKIGILYPNITYLNIRGNKTSPSLGEYDAVYVCGGNTFYILDRIRKTGLDRFLNSFVRQGGVYVGVSAGSIIAGKDIEIAGWGSEGDLNDINLKNLEGLNFTDIAVFPHYKPKLKREVEELRQRVNYPIETLKDKQAIMIKGKRVKRINA